VKDPSLPNLGYFSPGCLLAAAIFSAEVVAVISNQSRCGPPRSAVPMIPDPGVSVERQRSSGTPATVIRFAALWRGIVLH